MGVGGGGQQNLLVQIHFGSKQICIQKVRSYKYFGSKHFWSKKKSGSKKFGQKRFTRKDDTFVLKFLDP